MGSARVTGLLLSSILLCFVGQRALTQEDGPEWGDERDGLRTRLSAEKTAYAVDEPIRLTLELKSEKPEDWEYFPPQTLPREEGLIVRREGEPVRYIADDFSTGAAPSRLAAGATATFRAIALNRFWDVRQPGHYTVQFRETTKEDWGPGPPMGKAAGFRAIFPASNVVELEVQTPPDGRMPPLDITRRVQVIVAEGHGGISGWGGLAANYRPREFPATWEAFAGIFGIDWGSGPPVREDRLVALLLKLCNPTTEDELYIGRAEIDGSTIRIDIQHHPAAGDATRGRPFLFIPLARLLGAGEYTCQVRLTTHRPGLKGGPKTDGYEFGFEVLPRATEAAGAP